MARTGVRKFAFVVTLTVMMFAFLSAPASAQIYGRFNCTNGEPTDPDKALLLLEESDADLDTYGLTRTPPAEESEADSWLEALIRILRTLGLLPNEG